MENGACYDFRMDAAVPAGELRGVSTLAYRYKICLLIDGVFADPREGALIMADPLILSAWCPKVLF